MKASEPDFYLASTESYEFKHPRQCWRIKQLATPNRNDLLLVKIDPPLPVEEYGSRGPIDLVAIAPKRKGSTLFPISEWPMWVHVIQLFIDDPGHRDKILFEEFKSIAWAALYQTEEEACLKK
jgi:hypothetical protein